MMTHKDSLSHATCKRTDTVFSYFTKSNFLSKLRHWLTPSSTSSPHFTSFSVFADPHFVHDLRCKTKKPTEMWTVICDTHTCVMFSGNSESSALTQAAHQLLWTACPESSCSCFSLLLGFFGFILTLGISASKGSSSSSFPISTSARDSPNWFDVISNGCCISRFRVFVGLTSALLCHPRFPTADPSSQDNDQHHSHCLSLSMSLLGARRS